MTGNILPLRIAFKRFEPDAYVPSKGTDGAAGWDLYARENKLLLRNQPMLVDTGIGLELPGHYEAQIRPRSHISAKGILVQFGTIDSDYRGRLKVCMVLLGGDPYLVRAGDRIAQLVVAPVQPVEFYSSEVLGETARGESGFGSTGR